MIRFSWLTWVISGNHPSRKPLVLLRAFKSEWVQGSNPDDDPIPVITITELGHLSTQEDTLGQPKILSHSLYSWWSVILCFRMKPAKSLYREAYQKSKKTEDTDSSLVPGTAVAADNNVSANAPTPPVAEPPSVAAKRRTLLDRWVSPLAVYWTFI